jgi:hypothetical protein
MEVRGDAANLDKIAVTPKSSLERSKAAYRADLPALLAKNPRQWVAYADGNQVRIGASQRELYHYCLEDLKLTHDRFIVRRIIPESSPDTELIER